MTTERAGLPSLLAGRLAGGHNHHLSRSRTPFHILAGIQVAAAALCLLFALVGPHIGMSYTTLLTLSGMLLVLAAGTVWLLPLLPQGTGVDVALAVGYLLAAGCVVITPTAEGQALIGLGLASYGVFAAYFLTKARLLMSLVLLFLSLGLAEQANPQMSSPAVFWMIVAVISGLAILVSGLVERLRDLALHDDLTGLLNRRGLDVLAPTLLAACQRTGVPVTVGIVDLDQFKLFNDTHGHLAGDRLLQDVSTAWQGQLRDSDLAVRFGGDEFALVLVGSQLADAESLELRVRTWRAPTGRPPTSGWTAGWAEMRPGEGLYAAIERADEALLEAKRTRGANRA